MANEQNLKPFTSEQSREEAAKNGRKGGIASGEARRKRKLMAEIIQSEIDKPIKMNGVEVTREEAAIANLVYQINNKEIPTKTLVKALEFIRDTIGEKPVEKVEMATIDQSVIDEVERMVLDE